MSPNASHNIQLIVGLGNPGEEYASTRHNAGAWFVEMLAADQHTTFKNESKFHGKTASITLGGQRCYLLLPTTYMNKSGHAVKALAQFYQIPPQNILVAHDELDLPVGTVKLKCGGGQGGHNGLRHIAEQLGTNEFHRLRIGIDHPGHRDQVLNYVLKAPTRAQHEQIEEGLTRALHIVPFVVAGQMSKAMQQLHTSTTEK